MFGKKYMGVLRTTFIIDEKGFIERVIDDVKSKEHAGQILG
jgi:thioredoxin-dependent peroxiredoxin